MEPSAPGAARPRLRTRRSPLWLVIGILAVCLGGLASAWVHQSLTASDAVLRVNRTIHRGEVIAAQDLSVVRIGAGTDVRAVHDARVAEVVGRAASTDLPGGGLLVEGSWSEVAQPLGTSRVGLRLMPGRFPSTDLRPGSELLVVFVAEQNVAAEQGSLPGSVSGVLVAAPASQSDGSFTFDLHVPSGQAELVARLAAAERVSLVQPGSTR